ncbi:SDR family oxidoreductase [Brucella cytisi]|uniref:SDR family oxidoreductase n=1 Tax=Brucella cytisi TaxID=407152 RepID=UPI0035DEF7EC
MNQFKRSENEIMTTQTTLNLTGKRAIISAGASGIGLGIARAIVRAGGRVHVCDVNKDMLASLAASDPTITTSVANVSDSAAVDRMFDEGIEALGGLDILVNNAGIAGPTKLIEDIGDEEWRQTLEVNLTGQFYCTRRAVPLFKKARAGSIVNLSSMAGVMGLPMRAPYVAAKWAVIGVTKTLAMELGEYGIRVNAICPGNVEGERMEQVLAAEAAALNIDPQVLRHNYNKHTSLRTYVSANDIANMVVFICSDLGSRISGQALQVDGHMETLIARD